MPLMQSNVLFKVHGAKYSYKQRIVLRSIEHHYEANGAWLTKEVPVKYLER